MFEEKESVVGLFIGQILYGLVDYGGEVWILFLLKYLEKDEDKLEKRYQFGIYFEVKIISFIN